MAHGRQRRIAVALDLEQPYRCNIDVFAGCQTYADEMGWECVINPFADRALGAGHGGRTFDGVLAHATLPLVTAARRARVPLVNVSVNSPDESLPSVIPDCRAAGELAAKHLLGRGFCQFGFLGFSRDAFSRRQREGFGTALKGEGFSFTNHSFALTSYIANATGWEAFISGLGKWVESWPLPIGLYSAEDLPCRYLIEVCRSKGLEVPRDVGMVGSHDDHVICTSSSPTLTSINHGYVQIGYRAAALLHRLIDGEAPPEEPELVPPAELIPRQSSDSFAVDDPLVSRALRFIAEYCHQPLQVDQVATAVATSRRTLERRFRDSLGRSVAGETTRLRVERAKRRLVDDDAPISMIAPELGFRDADHFYKVFHRLEGISPTDYRRQRQNLARVQNRRLQ